MSNGQLLDVYITAAGAFMPNDPVSVDEMEEVLGLVGGKPSRYKKHVLQANGIKTRHYARDKNGQQTHLNEEMAALAVEDALKRRGYDINNIDMLATATTLGDVLMPGFASMVHGRLGGKPMDILSAGGICSASMQAMKAAYISIKAGEHSRAVSVGSELCSTVMKSSRFERESVIDEERDGTVDSFKYFNADFLRWMLSDGAGAVVMENEPNPNGLSLKVDWIEFNSYANQLPTCMYLGTKKQEGLEVGDTYLCYDTVADAEKDGLLVIRQDTNLLPKGLLQSVVAEAKALRERGLINADEIDHFLPHLSSYFFFEKFGEALAEVGVPIPHEKWFTNLSTKGNTGAASIYIMLEEALNTGLFKPGEKILCMIPESGRFSVSYAQFTCVGPS